MKVNKSLILSILFLFVSSAFYGYLLISSSDRVRSSDAWYFLLLGVGLTCAVLGCKLDKSNKRAGV